MKYFSTFSGIGGFELGIQSVIPAAECVGYSEIDKYACQVYQSHFPNHKNYGDITKIDINALPDFDLLVGGSPCQDLSIAKKDRQGLQGSRSGLFFKYVEILQTKKPRYFILENVNSMPKESKIEISRIMGVDPVMINASLVSGQNRKRLFWCNFLVNQPKDRGILLKDILEDNVDEKYYMKGNWLKWFYSDSGKKRIKFGMLKINGDKSKPLLVRDYPTWGGQYIQQVGQMNKGGQGNRIYNINGKSITLSAYGGGQGAKTGLYLDKGRIRKLTPTECARLQCFPDDWCSIVSNSQAYKCYGNAVNVEVIKHIVNCLINKPVNVQTNLF